MSNKFIQDTQNDVIQMKGVLSKGFGQLHKISFLDPDLSLEAKAILAYFCSYCGGGKAAFPGRDKILSDLHICKDAYYKHFKMLTSAGYITVAQAVGTADKPGFKHNVYTIENFPPKYSGDLPVKCSDAYKAAFLKVQAVKDLSAAGYGTIPKSIMTDDIPIQSKGIYAYLCVFSGQDFTASPSNDVMLNHLGISHNTSNKYMAALLQKNYVAKSQLHISGRFAGILYHLVQTPSVPESEILDLPSEAFQSPEPKISDTQISDTLVLPEPNISDTHTQSSPNIPDTHFSDAQIPDTNIPNANITKNNISSSLSPSQQNCSFPKDGSIEFEKLESEVFHELLLSADFPYTFTQNFNKMFMAIRLISDWNVRVNEPYYTGLQGAVKVRLYKLFAACISEMLCAGFDSYVKGVRLNYSRVYDLFQDILSPSDYSEVPYDIGSMPDDVVNLFLSASAERKIGNPKAYMKTIIYTYLENKGLSF